jgi:hypothetical protein
LFYFIFNCFVIRKYLYYDGTHVYFGQMKRLCACACLDNNIEDFRQLQSKFFLHQAQTHYYNTKCHWSTKIDHWVSLYVILHELAEGSSKCFKFHYLVPQSILLDTYFLFLPKKILVSICDVLIFLYQTVDLHKKTKLAHILCICGSIFTFLDIFYR